MSVRSSSAPSDNPPDGSRNRAPEQADPPTPPGRPSATPESAPARADSASRGDTGDAPSGGSPGNLEDLRDGLGQMATFLAEGAAKVTETVVDQAAGLVDRLSEASAQADFEAHAGDARADFSAAGRRDAGLDATQRTTGAPADDAWEEGDPLPDDRAPGRGAGDVMDDERNQKGTG
ncbi:hypothetical protein BX286_0067 [Streptomyces sp. 3211.6]|uniref:hypothetical protein n=1 Tax=Streptomyces sp. 3211.6 TaxID=1938845 RepID=UPI000C2BD74F|nr:hypothetical protein [Streptomyces sp. 3211.6]RKT02199.1 hypothetical protein BX286_0067 [Streptomyces sp. 3211.6]